MSIKGPNKLLTNRTPPRKRRYIKKIPFGDIQPSAKQIILSREIFNELRTANPKNVANVELVAKELSKKANLPYTVAFKLATKMVYGQRMNLQKV